MRDLFFWIFLLIGLPYLLFPLLILFTQKMEARPQFLPILPEAIPPSALSFLLNSADTLETCGFHPEAYLSLPSQMENIRVVLVLLVDRERGDKAAVTTILARQPDGTEKANSYVEFSTRFASGKVIDTMNSAVLGSFDALPNEIKTTFANERDLHLLCNLHRFIITDIEKIPASDAPVTYEPGKAVEYFTGVLVKGYDEQVERGVLRLDEKSGVYRPTVLGAYKMTWRLLFPLKQLLTAKRDARARQILTDYRKQKTGGS